jgi:hypothetical protein
MQWLTRARNIRYHHHTLRFRWLLQRIRVFRATCVREMSVGAKSFLIFGVGYRGGLLSNNDAAFIGVAEEYEAAKRRRPTMHKYYINFLTPRFQVIKDLNTSPDQPYRLLQYHHCCRRWPPVGDKAWAVVESRRLCDHAVVAFSKDSAASSDDANASAIRPALCTTMEFCRS